MAGRGLGHAEGRDGHTGHTKCFKTSEIVSVAVWSGKILGERPVRETLSFSEMVVVCMYIYYVRVNVESEISVHTDHRSDLLKNKNESCGHSSGHS